MTDGLQIEQTDDGLQLAGALDLQHIAELRAALRKQKVQVLEVSGLTMLDTAGALLLTQLAKKGARIDGLQEQHQELFKLLENTQAKPLRKRRELPVMYAVPVRVGKASLEALKTMGELTVFLGKASVTFGRTVRHPSRLRVGEIIHHIEQIGINALPIIALIAFLISVVLAYQSTEQLRPLGAQQFTINLITISVLREMGVLLTAIMVAGRSGSAFTAEIGVMKVREEVDALKAIGIDPFELLVLPRLIALMISLPLLTFVADLMGLLGGAVLTDLLIGISYDTYFSKVHEIAANGKALLVGLIKAPVFALAIGLVACMQGMQVSGSAESVGRKTTTSVVQSIFLVLVIDALFSIFFQKVGL